MLQDHQCSWLVGLTDSFGDQVQSASIGSISVVSVVDAALWNPGVSATFAWSAEVPGLAGARQRSAYWIMREALSQYVEREEARESLKQEALASWQAYQDNGQHLTGSEARAWLKPWGTEDEAVICLNDSGHP